MRKLIDFWYDDNGSVIASEYLMLASVVALGGFAGLSSVRDAVNDQSNEVSKDIKTIHKVYHLDKQEKGVVSNPQKECVGGICP